MENETNIRRLNNIPRILDNLDVIEKNLRHKYLFAAFDFDGTLAPINNDPDAVFLSKDMKMRLEGLSRVCKVAIVTGRDLRDIRYRAGVPGLFYSGSHGFEISGPEGSGVSFEAGGDYLDALEEAEGVLETLLAAVPGAVLQRKRFSISVHYRMVKNDHVPVLKSAVEEMAQRLGVLRARHDKKAIEVLPDKDWNKGSATLWLLEKFGMTPENSFSIFVGDDVTDEDGFRAVQGRGSGVIVAETEPPDTTCADYRLDSICDTGVFIEALVRICSGGIKPPL